MIMASLGREWFMAKRLNVLYIEYSEDDVALVLRRSIR